MGHFCDSLYLHNELVSPAVTVVSSGTLWGLFPQAECMVKVFCCLLPPQQVRALGAWPFESFFCDNVSGGVVSPAELI